MRAHITSRRPASVSQRSVASKIRFGAKVAALAMTLFAVPGTVLAQSLWDVLYDEFDQPYLERWTPSQSAGAVFTQGASDLNIYIPKPAAECSNAKITHKFDISGEDLIVTMHARKDGAGAFFLRIRNQASPQSEINLHLNTDDAPWLVVQNVVAGNLATSVLGSSSSYLNHWITMEIRKVGNSYSFYMDGSQVGGVATNNGIGSDALKIEVESHTCAWKSGPANDTIDWLSIESSSQPVNCVGFAAPMDEGIVLKKNKKGAIPLKVQLLDNLGLPVDDSSLAAPPVVMVSFSPTLGVGSEDYSEDVEPIGHANEGNEFRYDADTMSWIYNLGTRQYSATGTYGVMVASGDPSYFMYPETCHGVFERLGN